MQPYHTASSCSGFSQGLLEDLLKHHYQVKCTPSITICKLLSVRMKGGGEPVVHRRLHNFHANVRWYDIDKRTGLSLWYCFCHLALREMSLLLSYNCFWFLWKSLHLMSLKFLVLHQGLLLKKNKCLSAYSWICIDDKAKFWSTGVPMNLKLYPHMGFCSPANMCFEHYCWTWGFFGRLAWWNLWFSEHLNGLLALTQTEFSP